MSYVVDSTGKKYNFGGKKVVVPGNSIESILQDGNTIGWYRTDVSSTMTITVNSSVNQWNDYLGSGNNLTPYSPIGERAPNYSTQDGVLFNGLSSAGQTIFKLLDPCIGQPIQVHMVLKAVTWSSGDLFFGDMLRVRQRISAPGIEFGNGTSFSETNYDFPLSTWGILTVVFNKQNSFIRVNKSKDSSMSIAVSNLMDGSLSHIIVGSGQLGSSAANINVKEVIFRKTADSTEKRENIYNYLANKYGLVEPSALLRDGNTFGWYKFDASVTKTDSSVSKWADVLGSFHDLDASGKTASPFSPIWSASDGLIFDGSTSFLKTDPCTWAQPAYYYLVFKYITLHANKFLCAGITGSTSSYVRSQNLSSAHIMYAGSSLFSPVADIANNTWAIGRFLFNGASSSLQINASSKTEGNAGTEGPGGFILGNHMANFATVDVNNSNIAVKEVILRKTADSSTNSDIIYRYLKNKYGL